MDSRSGHLQQGDRHGGHRRDGTTLVVLALVGAGAALLAGDVDPYVLRPAGPMLPLPSRFPLEVVQRFLLALALFLLLGRRLARPRITLALTGLLAMLSPILLLMATPFTRPEIHIISVALNVVILLTFGAHLVVSHRPEIAGRRSAMENAATAGFTLVFAFLVGEAIATALPASHAVGYTLSSRLWYEKYWNLSDVRGYRDADPDAGSGRRIYVLGDSFVTGVGIRDVEERFSNILHRRLAPEFRVYNVGRNGSDTRDEYRRLRGQPQPPDLLILFYYTNDIQEACKEWGHKIPGFTPYSNLPRLVKGLVRRSYLLDLAYWQFPQVDLFAYESALEACYADPQVLQAHVTDLARFVDYSHAGRIPLLVIAFPHLVNAEATRRLIEPVIRFFRDRDVLLIDVFPLIAHINVGQRIVNRNDAHPSPWLNRLVAEVTLSTLKSGGLLRQAQAR